MNKLPLLLCIFAGWSLAGASLAQPKFASAIPDRPEKLEFPPLLYEPPSQTSFRVQLKSGPVAYVAADRS
jgi:hypothetical protein